MNRTEQTIPTSCTAVIVDATECSIRTLTYNLEARGFGYKLPQREDGTVLRQVATEISKKFCPEGSRFRLESRTDPAENGYELVMVTPGETGNTYQTVAAVKIDAEKRISVERYSELVPYSFRSDLEYAFPSELDRLDSSSVTRLLIRAVEDHRGFSMRRAGGVYAVPKDYADRFEQFIECLNASDLTPGKLSFRPIRLPVDPLTSASTAASCIQHLMAECNTLGEELQQMQVAGTKMTTPGEHTRRGKIQTLRDMLESLREIIGPAADTCADAIQHCENLVLAVNAREYAQALALD